jgi:hypothetical protein
MQQAHWPRMEVATAANYIVAAQAVLVPPVLDRRHVAREHQQERRQRPQLVDLPRRRPLYLHPPLDALGVARFPPPLQVEHHDPRVEVARVAVGESPDEALVRPEPCGEVLCEVGVAVLRRADGAAAEVGAPELGDVVDEDEVGVEVDDAADAWLEQAGEVVARVVERLLQGLPHRRGDEPPDAVGVKVVNLEPEPREDGADEVPEARVGDEEVEEDALGAPGVLHHRVDGGDGAPQVLLVERDRDVYEGGVADVAAVGGGAVGGIAERRRAAEGDPSGAARDLAGEADAAVELRGPDGLGGREGLERRRQHHHQHGGGEEAGQARHPQHRGHPVRPPLPCAGSPVSRRPLRPHRHAVQPRDGVGQVVGNAKGGTAPAPQLDRVAVSLLVADRSLEWGRSERESMRGQARRMGVDRTSCRRGKRRRRRTHQPTAIFRFPLPPFPHLYGARSLDGGGCYRSCCLLYPPLRC